MKRTIEISTLVLLLSISFSVPLVLRPTSAAPYIDPGLASSWSTAAATDVVEVVVTLDHIPTASDSVALAALSRVAVPMTELPMILSVTTYGNLASIASHTGVVALHQNAQLEYHNHIQTTTHSFGEVPVQHSWWNDVMRVPEAWALGYRGQGVTVAVVDTGVDATNPSLGFSFPNGLRSGSERVIQNVKVLTVAEFALDEPLGPDQIFIENQPNTDTTGGHGTSVAGLIAGTGAQGNGIYKGTAPQARIVGLGAGETLAIFHIIASYNWILSHRVQYGIKIVNNSWGSGFTCQPCRDPNFPINIATRTAHDRGIAVFFSAGNAGPKSPTINPYSEHSWVVSVAAGTESRGLAEFSSRGAKTNLEQQPDVTAPGINVITTRATTGTTDTTLSSSTDTGNIVNGLQPFYTTFGGTSAASPLAAAVGALVLSAHDLTPDELKATLKATADPMLGYLSFQTGKGYVNALSSVRAALGKNFTPTTTPVERSGIQRFVYTAFTGGEIAVTANWMSANFPVFQGARQIVFEVTWPVSSYPIFQWEGNIYAGNDYAVADCGRTRTGSPCPEAPGVQTGFSYSVDDAAFIASLNNQGQTAGTWDVRVFNFGPGSSVTLVVDVVY